MDLWALGHPGLHNEFQGNRCYCTEKQSLSKQKTKTKQKKNNNRKTFILPIPSTELVQEYS